MKMSWGTPALPGSLSFLSAWRRNDPQGFQRDRVVGYLVQECGRQSVTAASAMLHVMAVASAHLTILDQQLLSHWSSSRVALRAVTSSRFHHHAIETRGAIGTPE